MDVLITGATGFVGLNIVEALVAGGHRVRAIVRAESRRTWLERFPVEMVETELSDVAGVASAIGDAECIIHTAGDTSHNHQEWRRLRATNIEGTRGVLDAARRRGVRRIVYTSTSSTIGSDGRPESRAVEVTPLTGFRARSPYAVTKGEAERLLLESGGNGPECVILNVAEVLGPYDHSLNWGRIVLAVLMGRVPFVPPGSGSFCPSRDVAAAHVAALTKGRAGERYIIAGHDVSYSSLFAEIARVTGGDAAPINGSPYAWQRFLSEVMERLKPWTGRAPAVDPYRMRVFGGHYLFDDSKARAELDYNPRPLAIAIEECARWYRENGFLPGAKADVAPETTIIRETE